MVSPRSTKEVVDFTKYSRVRNKVLHSNRIEVGQPYFLREDIHNYKHHPITERLIQFIWNDQRIDTEYLQTVDGRSVKVIFPGWWNMETGPDFQKATIQVGTDEAVTGDVEIHLQSEDWNRHRHHLDPVYNDVILHVVYFQPRRPRTTLTQAGAVLPEIVLEHKLASQIGSLYEEINQDAYPLNQDAHGDQCRALLAALPMTHIHELLNSAGDERFFTKMQRFAEQIAKGDAAQAFYEGWMEALGYKSNKLAFRTLAQRTPLELLIHNQQRTEAYLMGIANFLPTRVSKTHDPFELNHVKRIWKTWWKLRPACEEQILPRSLWKLHGIRPSNHPHRRVGAAASLIQKHPNLLEKLIDAVDRGCDLEPLFADLHNEYWEHHSTLGGKFQKRATQLIGEGRSKEIVTNVVLPFLAAYSIELVNEGLQEKVLARYAALPLGPTNSVLRLASQHLFVGSHISRDRVTTTRQQQGLLQIFYDFCVNGKSACKKCRLPDLVAHWNVCQ